jgi:hypothetical protein
VRSRSIELIVRADELGAFRSRLRAAAQSDGMCVRTYTADASENDLSYIIAELVDHSFGDEHALERLRRKIAEIRQSEILHSPL